MPATPPPCVIDIEASGFGAGSYPIEVGYVRGDGLSWCSLIQPGPEWNHWDANAERAHGITPDLLRQHGRPVDEVAAKLNADLAGLDVYCDGWAHDYSWLAKLFDAAGSLPRFHLRHFRELLAQDALARWDGVYAGALGTLSVSRHRASADARVLQLALCRAGGGG